MNDFAQIERKNNRIGIAISVTIHLILLLLFLWITVWKEPYPPAPEYGIELNIGMSEQGSGAEPVAPQPEESEEEVQEETAAEVEEEVTEPEDETVESTSETESVDEVEEVAEQDAVTQEDAPVKVEEKKSEPKKKTETAKEQPKPVEEKKEEKPKANPNALFPGSNTSQGETNNKSGDQGVEDGKVDSKNLMGPQGGGSGSQLDMAGWTWDSPPNPKDNSDQNGKIVFEITVDSNGEVISVRLKETTVSPDIVKVYQNEVAKLSFSRTSGGVAPNQSSGKITFLIRSK
ncbi:hypothetical protein JKA74_04225 [Marivirga sp. S37H4]|uniref:Energy transducer TonB n=1 Tax=Marivirga aurantiaca TaxID=2802615 RepID=A0A934WWJ1_9BACT|nr:hypothetical protein [Marivirga aurantiaca]MBK6264232.1 hypothetical protein [Marivirga aurantiaca]